MRVRTPLFNRPICPDDDAFTRTRADTSKKALVCLLCAIPFTQRACGYLSLPSLASGLPWPLHAFGVPPPPLSKTETPAS